MEITSFLLIVVIIECAVLLVLSLVGKLTKRLFALVAGISAVTAVAAFIISMPKDVALMQSHDLRESLYLSQRLIEEDHLREALDELAPHISDGEDNKDYVALRALAQNLRGGTGISAETIERFGITKDELLETLYKKSYRSESVGDILIADILDMVSKRVDATDDEKEQWETELGAYIEYGNEAVAETHTDDYRMIARRQILAKRYRDAYDTVMAVAENSNPQADVILSEMYVLGYDGRSFVDNDEEYDVLLKRLTEREAAVARTRMRASDESEDADPAEIEKMTFELEQAQASFVRAQDELDDAAVKRAIKYLVECGSVPSAYKPYHDLQLSYLYFLIRDYGQARAHLDEVFKRASHGGDELARMAAEVRDAYVMVKARGYGEDFSVAMDELIATLYGNTFPDFTDKAFNTFVNNYVADAIAGITLESVSVSAWPQVTIKAHATSGIGSLANLDLMDTSDAIGDFEVSEYHTEGGISVCYVLDVSGSMEGKSLVDAKEAVRMSAAAIKDQSQVGLVSFSDSARIESGLTHSAFSVSVGLSRLMAEGGTDISAGISTAVDVLADAAGRPIIILLSDGFDMNDAAVTDAIARANEIGASVYTVGLEGADEEYLTYIARETGGTFTFVDNTAHLPSVLSDIQDSIDSAYLITYAAPEKDLSERYVYVTLEGTQSEARLDYTPEAGAVTHIDSTGRLQKAGYFRETGGTMEEAK